MSAESKKSVKPKPWAKGGLPGPKSSRPDRLLKFLAWEAAIARHPRSGRPGRSAEEARTHYRRYADVLLAAWNLGRISIEQLAAMRVLDVYRICRDAEEILAGERQRRAAPPPLRLANGVVTAGRARAADLGRRSKALVSRTLASIFGGDDEAV